MQQVNKKFSDLLEQCKTPKQVTDFHAQLREKIAEIQKTVRTKYSVGKACICECHIRGVDTKHMFPCCEICYDKFINQDGTVDSDSLYLYLSAKSEK